jgi:hypothetical protein
MVLRFFRGDKRETQGKAGISHAGMRFVRLRTNMGLDSIFCTN